MPLPISITADDLTVPEAVSSPPSAEAPLFGRYRVARELGRGGMGVVLLAHDTVLDVSVALKLIPDTVVRDTEGILDLKKEVLRGMELTHPNVVRVFSFEQSSTTAAIVMEHVQGETLGQAKLQRPNRCFDCADVQPWLEQLCAALDYAHHEARIAHRDLKPGNLMLTPSGRLKVADFGIASSLSDTMSRISVRADSSGTPPYMSPQQAMGERPTHLDDIYSLGATIYELLTSKPPFFRGNILAQVMNEEPLPMAERRAELGITDGAPIPASWEKMIAACLAKEPAARPGSGAAILAMLRHPERSLAPASFALENAAVSRAVAAPPVQRIHPRPVSVTPASSPAVRQVRHRQAFSVQPLVDACAAVIQGTGSLLGAVLRPILKLALVIAALWGSLFLKSKWDANQEEVAARQAAARSSASVQAKATPLPPHGGTVGMPPPRSSFEQSPSSARGPLDRRPPPPHKR